MSSETTDIIRRKPAPSLASGDGLAGTHAPVLLEAVLAEAPAAPATAAETILAPVRDRPVDLRADSEATALEASLAWHNRRVLEHLGEDPEREGLQKTPLRVARAMQFLTQGYHADPAAILQKALFAESYDEMIVVSDIEVFSLCEHHMLPFYGKAHVAYIPDGHIVGLSKIPRVVDVFARRLQVQERLTTQIRDSIQGVLQPRGVAVVIEATHLCMVMRGVQKQHAATTTSAMSGAFLDDPATRAEFMRLVRGRG